MTRHSLCGRCSFNCELSIIMCSICNFVATTLLPERFRQSHAKPQIAHNESRTNWFDFENHSISVRDRWQGTAASARCCHVIICFFFLKVIFSVAVILHRSVSVYFWHQSGARWRICCALATHRPRINERTLIMCNDGSRPIASYRYRYRRDYFLRTANGLARRVRSPLRRLFEQNEKEEKRKISRLDAEFTLKTEISAWS